MKSGGLIRLSDKRDILHIVSGHSVGGTLRSSDTPSDNIVVWYDDLTLGPARGKTLEETTRIRTRFFRELSRSSRVHYETELLLPPSYLQRNRILRRCGEWREVALWFGPSVMEQFSLLQVLAAIAEQDLEKTRLTLVTCPKFSLQVYPREKISEFFESRTALPRKHIGLAARAWWLYCGPDPMPLFHFARRHARSAPVLCNALSRQLERFPSIQNGLSRLEDALLRQVEVGGTVVRAVANVLRNDEEAWAGDVELFDSLLGFLTCPTPLIEPVGKNYRIKPSLEFRKLAVRLSAMGRDVLAGQADNVALNGVDRWIGGVHLKAKSARWRWDCQEHVLKSW